MKIAFVASEMVPFAKTGGLADVIGSLTEEIRLLGHEVVVFLPRYKAVDLQRWNLAPAADIEITIGGEKERGRLLTCSTKEGVKVYFIDHPDFFNRDTFYGTALGDFPDNDKRFVFFQRGVLEGLKKISFKPDVIHCHDWQTGLIPVYLKTLHAGDSFFSKTKTVFTIHNLAYQGNFPPDSLPATGLSWDQFKIDRLEFYGKVSFLKGALWDADIVTTVSERYSQEIQSKEFGCGMEGILAKRRDAIHGVVNGIDLKEWNPETDKDLVAQFSAQKIDKKAANKSALQKENYLTLSPKTPLLGVVSRLVDQKGIDILIPALSAILQQDAQFVLLGTGEERYHHTLREFAKKNKGRASVHILFDPVMAKHIYAGCDMMLLPSYYEPCGLGQMIALRFGTIPIVRETGGLADTITDFDAKTGRGNGFTFRDYTSDALLGAVHRAVEAYRSEKKWSELIHNAMASDFSWGASAKKYEHLYESLKKKPSGVEKDK